MNQPARINTRRPRRPLGLLGTPAVGRSTWLRLRSLLGITVLRYVAFVSIAGLGLLALPPSWSDEPSHWLPAFAALTIASIVLEFVTVELPHEGVLSVATISHIATILLVPPPFAAISVGGAVLVEQLWHRKALVKLAFNTTNYLVTASLCSLIVGLVGSPVRAVIDQQFVQFIVMFASAGIAYYLVNDLLTSGIIALVTERPVLYVFRSNARNTFTAEVGAATVGALFAVVWSVHPVWTLLLTVPGSVITRALQYIRQLESETRSAVKALAGTIDDRDESTFHHSKRVAEYAVLIARQMGLPLELVDLIEQAAEVHDLGKIGVPDRILLKPGPLTQSEMTAMWLHTEIGAKILSRFQLFRPGVDVVLHHHENYDGTGYPGGLAGEEIPLGARLMAVADAFDAMTSDRSYRKALSQEEALRRLREGAGSQWDPIVIGTFLKLVGEGRLTVEGRPEPIHRPDPTMPDPYAPESAPAKRESEPESESESERIVA